MAAGYTVTGIGATIRGFGMLRKNIRDAVWKEIKNGAADISRDAKRMAPIETGTLRRSIQIAVNKKRLEAFVGSGIKYSIYQEFGTSKMKAHPYLIPALKKNRTRILQRITKAVEKGGKRI